jgi:nucleoside-diphosphate-sugar epimerase
MRILLTGATGFVGEYLARSLCPDHVVAAILRPQAKVVRLDSLPAVHKLLWDGLSSSLHALLKEFRPEVVIHLASCFIGEHKAEDLDQLISSNIHFPSVLIEAAIGVGCRQFIHTGSAWQHFENKNYSPVNLYAATKQAFSDILEYYIGTGKLEKCLTLVLTDTYGPEDPRSKLIPLLQKASISGESMKMSLGEQFLDLVHIYDVVSGYLKALEMLSTLAHQMQHIYVVRSGRPIKLKDFIVLYNQISPTPVNVTWGTRPYRVRETMEPFTWGDTLPGWTPQIELHDGLREILVKLR